MTMMMSEDSKSTSEDPVADIFSLAFLYEILQLFLHLYLIMLSGKYLLVGSSRVNTPISRNILYRRTTAVYWGPSPYMLVRLSGTWSKSQASQGGRSRKVTNDLPQGCETF